MCRPCPGDCGMASCVRRAERCGADRGCAVVGSHAWWFVSVAGRRSQQHGSFVGGTSAACGKWHGCLAQPWKHCHIVAPFARTDELNSARSAADWESSGRALADQNPHGHAHAAACDGPAARGAQPEPLHERCTAGRQRRRHDHDDSDDDDDDNRRWLFSAALTGPAAPCSLLGFQCRAHARRRPCHRCCRQRPAGFRRSRVGPPVP
mmetsp:Transcript_104814/g.301344  ORF Transcript_104814/g.301344 Transcript_104814/m.301344 type:complete len:207 (-) Transcript_104814:179-799(-)